MYLGDKWNYKHGVVKQYMIEVRQVCWNVILISYLPGQLRNFTLLAALETGLGNGNNNCNKEVRKLLMENESTELENVYFPDSLREMGIIFL